MKYKLGRRRRAAWRSAWDDLQSDFGHPDLSVEDLYYIIRWWEDRQQRILIEEGSLRIPTIGTITIRERAGHDGFITKAPPRTKGGDVYVPPIKVVRHLRIKTSADMRRKIMSDSNDNEQGMVKLGVHTQPHPQEGSDKTAQAQAQDLCPQCGHPVQVVMGQRCCPTHGTGPVER